MKGTKTCSRTSVTQGLDLFAVPFLYTGKTTTFLNPNKKNKLSSLCLGGAYKNTYSAWVTLVQLKA